MRLFPILIPLLPWAVHSQSSITTDKSSYNVGEPIAISWNYPGRDASNGDRIGVSNDSDLSPDDDGTTVPSSLMMWVYANTLTQTYQRGKATEGSVTFDENDPVETGLVAWPLGVGSYRAHIVRDAADPPFSVVVSSAVFAVASAGTSGPTINPTTSNPTASPTNVPTSSPTTSNPTNAPLPVTPGPSSSPTTSNPTISPTTSNPTSFPTEAPTSSPTTSPPTRAPVPMTLSPTSAPTTGSPTDAPVLSVSLSASKTDYAENEDIVLAFAHPDNPGSDAWIGLWPADSDPGALPQDRPYWNYICSDDQDSGYVCPSHPTAGSVTLNSDAAGSEAWPLTCGLWRAYLIESETSDAPYVAVAVSEAFTVGGYTTCEGQVCNAVPEDGLSSSAHLVPTEGATISKIAFSSCYVPNVQNDPALWQHVRTNFGSSHSVWNWLGDNMYEDSENSQQKRFAYYQARTHPYYVNYGPVAEPKIPVTGTWDDHDYAFNDAGDNYACRQASQNEFVYHFNIPESDPRHPAYAGGQQAGVYSSNMFTTDTSAPGIHLINLDARYHRSPTFSVHGRCERTSTMLGETQWTWLESELSRPSEIKVIGSGVQVLPPTHRQRSLSDYCAYDKSGGTFDTANAEMGEGEGFDGSQWESWAEIPQERTRLLKLVQESINAGNAKQIVFISGDSHWAEMMAKEIPARSGQPAVTVYEVTGSGIDQKWPFNILNSNRLRPENYGYRNRRNLKGQIPKGQNRKGRKDEAPAPQGKAVSPGMRQRKLQKPAPKTPMPTVPPADAPTSSPTPIPPSPIKSITYSGMNTCSGDSLHICSAKANYGGIEVDWGSNELHLVIYTPFQSEQEAARVIIDIGSAASTASHENIFE